jgi:AcrR family transcriptional regulator
MNTPATTRPYRMAARAEAAARTARRIVEAAVALWHEGSVEAITLEAIAARAGVSARTVIRRFGSRDGVMEAAIASESARIAAERDAAPSGDLEGALEALLRHYERDGDAVLRTLALEESVDLARSIVETGRAVHREGCARWFATHLPPPDDPGYGTRLDAFVAATDIYVWKLLRRDLARSPRETFEVIRTLVHALLHQPHDSR